MKQRTGAWVRLLGESQRAFLGSMVYFFEPLTSWCKVLPVSSRTRPKVAFVRYPLAKFGPYSERIRTLLTNLACFRGILISLATVEAFGEVS